MNRLQPIIDRWQAWAKAHNVTFTPGMDKTDPYAEQLTADQLNSDHITLHGLLSESAWADYGERDQVIHDRAILSALLFSFETELAARKVTARWSASASALVLAALADQAQAGLSMTPKSGGLSIPAQDGQLSPEPNGLPDTRENRIALAKAALASLSHQHHTISGAVSLSILGGDIIDAIHALTSEDALGKI